MRLYSIKNRSEFISFWEVVLCGLFFDNGLYMFEFIFVLFEFFICNLKDYFFQDIVFIIMKIFFQGVILDEDLWKIMDDVVNFEVLVVFLNEYQYILELFYGLLLAFKDFGVCFMVQFMSYFNQGEFWELVILVAIFGDIGGVVVVGFY